MTRNDSSVTIIGKSHEHRSLTNALAFTESSREQRYGRNDVHVEKGATEKKQLQESEGDSSDFETTIISLIKKDLETSKLKIFPIS